MIPEKDDHPAIRPVKRRGRTMSGQTVSVSLPARFLSAGQDVSPGPWAAPGFAPGSLLLAVREDAAAGAGGSRASCPQALLLSPGDSLPGEFVSRTARWFWIRFRMGGGPDLVQVPLGPRPVPLSETAFNRFSCGFHQLIGESGGSSDLCDYMLSVLLLSLRDDSGAAPRSAVAARLLEYIRLHCCEPLTLPDAARDLGYSEDYLSRLLHEQVSCSFRRYIHLLRLQRAKRELLSGFRSIQEIAEDCGYPNAKFFSTIFRKYEGVTPSAFRNLYASGAGRANPDDD